MSAETKLLRLGQWIKGLSRGATSLLINRRAKSQTPSRMRACASARDAGCGTTLGAIAGALILGVAGASTASAAPVALWLPQGTAFAILGHSCGGIQEHVFATGFNPTSGWPTGDVFIQTRCGGSGRGGGYHTTTYSAWVGVTWDFAGNVLSAGRLATAPAVNPTLTVTDAFGDEVFNTGAAAYLNVPAPDAPTDVSALQSGDQFDVTWIPNGG